MSASRIAAVRLVFCLTLTGLLGGCQPPAEIESPPPPSSDPAAAFPRYDAVYREPGNLGGKNSDVADLLHVRYFRFFADGTVRSTTGSTGRDRRVTKAMNQEWFEALAAGSDHEYALSGTFRVTGEEIAIRVGRPFVHQGKRGETRLAFAGKVVGDQLKLTRQDPDTGKRMSPETTYWPAERP